MDSQLVEKIVHEVKSQGVFDEFRKDSMSDVDTKPAYQNLRQRVENSVKKFLADTRWTPETNKIQLREKLRRHITESGFLDVGVERIVDQVVNPKICTVFQPRIEEIAYKYLGVPPPPPMKYDPPPPPMMHHPLPPLPLSGSGLKVETTSTSLLPTGLEQVSPDSDKQTNKSEEPTDNVDMELETDEKLLDDDDESPPFEPVIKNEPMEVVKKETLNADDKESERKVKIEQEIIKKEQIKLEKDTTSLSEDAPESQDSQLSSVSSDSRLTPVIKEELNNSQQEETAQAQNMWHEDTAAQMPTKFNENSSSLPNSSSKSKADLDVKNVDLHFDIKKDEIKFEGTERKCDLEDMHDTSDSPTPTVATESCEIDKEKSSFKFANNNSNAANQKDNEVEENVVKKDTMLADTSLELSTEDTASITPPPAAETPSTPKEIEKERDISLDTITKSPSSPIILKEQTTASTPSTTPTPPPMLIPTPTPSPLSVQKSDKSDRLDSSDRSDKDHHHSKQNSSSSSSTSKHRKYSKERRRSPEKDKDRHRSDKTSSSRHHSSSSSSKSSKHSSSSKHTSSSSSYSSHRSNEKDTERNKTTKHSTSQSSSSSSSSSIEHNDSVVVTANASSKKDKRHHSSTSSSSSHKERKHSSLSSVTKRNSEKKDDHYEVKQKNQRRKSNDSNDEEDKSSAGPAAGSAGKSSSGSHNRSSSSSKSKSSKSNNLNESDKSTSKCADNAKEVDAPANSTIRGNVIILNDLLENPQTQFIQLECTTTGEGNHSGELSNIKIFTNSTEDTVTNINDIDEAINETVDDINISSSDLLYFEDDETKCFENRLNLVNTTMDFCRRAVNSLRFDWNDAEDDCIDFLTNNNNNNNDDEKEFTQHKKARNQFLQELDEERIKTNNNNNNNNNNHLVYNTVPSSDYETPRKRYKHSLDSTEEQPLIKTSPTPSDCSVNSKENESFDKNMDNLKKNFMDRHKTGQKLSQQRYSSEDLYKPRPVLGQRSRRRGMDSINN